MAEPAKMPGAIAFTAFTWVLGMKMYSAINMLDINRYGIKSMRNRIAGPSNSKSGIESAMVAIKIEIPEVMTRMMGNRKNMAR
jgi:hypothetical protein